jgi:hypothetical protein
MNGYGIETFSLEILKRKTIQEFREFRDDLLLPKTQISLNKGMDQKELTQKLRPFHT